MKTLVPPFPVRSEAGIPPSSRAMDRRTFLLAGVTLGTVASHAVSAPTPAPSSAKDEADLVIWDSTPAGLSAAIAAARIGLSVIIVTEDLHVGGVQTSGLGYTNIGQLATIGGITREFHQRVMNYYREKYGSESEPARACLSGFRFEPHIAERVWDDWLREAGVRIVREEVIQSVEKRGARLTTLRTASGRGFRGRMFIDASYEGDLLAAAQCSFHLGREARARYGESLAGGTYPPQRVGQGDHRLQAFNYRCCLTDVVANRVPFTQPPDYTPANYAWHLAQIKRVGANRQYHPLRFNLMPFRKTDSRVAEWPGHSWDYVEATRVRRAAIERAHRHHSAGYLWYLLTDAAVPQFIREETARWGLAADEFRDNGNWPRHIYVREGRRLVGEYVMTQRDCIGDRFKPDSIGVCSWYLDVHPVELFPVGDGFETDGLIYVSVQPFEIPWRSLLPKAREADNLLVPVALSASHVAFSAIRVEPVWMILGHAAGVGAALALREGAVTPVHQLPVNLVRRKLEEQGQVIDARLFNDYWPSRPARPLS